MCLVSGAWLWSDSWLAPQPSIATMPAAAITKTEITVIDADVDIWILYIHPFSLKPVKPLISSFSQAFRYRFLLDRSSQVL